MRRSRIESVLMVVIGATLIVSIKPLCHAQATSRVEEIEQQRIDKQARVWPERTSGFVKQLNKLTERGLLEGAESKKGANGPQIVLGGMRAGQGAAFGVGYRRVDLWGERIGFRATARGTFQSSYMFDLEIDFPRLNSTRGELRLYTKHENSPQMDFYGSGPDSFRANRTSYRLEDTGIHVEGKYRLWKGLHAGGSFGGYFPNTGPGQRSDYPSTDEKFDPEEVPGLDAQPDFFRAGILLQYDYRDLRTGPRSGGNYYARYTRHWDRDLHRHNFVQLDTAVEQYIPYWNKTRVVLLRFGTVMTWAADGQTVPFYLQPTLGGNDFLRGYSWYRFYDQNAILANVEHRWHLFSGGHAAVFFDMGKVANKATQLNFHNLEYSGGIGFRFTIRNAVVMRIDNAVSREGYRLIWTFTTRF
jgi:outer membrane protein assembly factor BamA